MFGVKKRKLRCSFCGKSQTDVARLIGGGAGKYICDACVGLCTSILQATPVPFAGWETLSEEQLLAAVRSCESGVAALRALQQAQVAALRKREASWAKIGAALGVSRQAAWERFS